MTISHHDQQVLGALAEARAKHEGLADLLDFYYELYQAQFAIKASLAEPEVRDELAMRWRLEGGIPQLTFDQLKIEPESFVRLTMQMTDVLLRHNPTWEIDRGDWTGERTVALAQEMFEAWDTLTGPKSDLDVEEGVQPLALAVGFALAPHLQRAGEAILPLLELDLWSRGYCPICGGRPNFALLEQERGARQLMCARCSSLWQYSRVGCPFCKSKEKQSYYLSEDGLYRLYVCPSCNHYLKTIDLREVQREVYPMVERLLTVGMDLAARQEGFEA